MSVDPPEGYRMMRDGEIIPPNVLVYRSFERVK